MRRHKCADGDEIKPKEFKKNGYIKTGGIIAGKQAPKKADNQWALKQAYAQGISEQRKQGKKKATRANQRYGFDMYMI